MPIGSSERRDQRGNRAHYASPASGTLTPADRWTFCQAQSLEIEQMPSVTHKFMPWSWISIEMDWCFYIDIGYSSVIIVVSILIFT